jgi:hypothetical protein
MKPESCRLPSYFIPEVAVFWAVALCSLVEVYRRFRGACCLHHRPAVGT